MGHKLSLCASLFFQLCSATSLAGKDFPLSKEALEELAPLAVGGVAQFGTATDWTPEDNGPELGDDFGREIAIAGDWAAVSAPRDEVADRQWGKVYLFFYTSSGWRLAQTLIAPPGSFDFRSPFTGFGTAVALHGNELLISLGSSHVFSYRLIDGVWTYHSSFSLPFPSRGGARTFGIALQGETALIGQAWPDSGYGEQGSVRVFQKIGNAWTMTDTIVPPIRRLTDQFGESLTLKGDTLIVGAPGIPPSLPNDPVDYGSAHVFRRIEDAWVWQGSLSRPEKRPFPLSNSDGFGSSVHLVAGRLFVGTSNWNQTFAYVDTETGWKLEATFPQGNGAFDGNTLVLTQRRQHEALSFFRDGETWLPGPSVQSQRQALDNACLDGGRLLTANLTGYVAGEAPGALTPLQAYALASNAWQREIVEMPTESDATLGDLFGTSVAASGELVAVGVPGDTDFGGGNATGRVDVFSKAGILLARVKRPDRDLPLRFGQSIALDGETLVVAAPVVYRLRGDFPGRVYVFRLQRNKWELEARLEEPNSMKAYSFGSVVTISGDSVLVGTEGLELSRGSPCVAAYRRVGGTWKFDGTLAAVRDTISGANLSVGDYPSFMSIDVKGDIAAVGLRLPSARKASHDLGVYGRRQRGWQLIRALPRPSVLIGNPWLDSGLRDVRIDNDTLAVAGYGGVDFYSIKRMALVKSSTVALNAPWSLGSYAGGAAFSEGTFILGNGLSDYYPGIASLSPVFGIGDKIWGLHPSVIPDLQSDGNSMPSFGYSVAQSGSTAYVGMPDLGSKSTAWDGKGGLLAYPLTKLSVVRLFDGGLDPKGLMGPDSVFPNGRVLRGSQARFDLTLVNLGTAPTPDLAYSFSGPNAEDFHLAQEDSTPLAGAMKRRLQLVASPPAAAAGLRSATLTITSLDGRQGQGLPITLNLRITVVGGSYPTDKVAAAAPVILLANSYGVVRPEVDLVHPVDCQWYKGATQSGAVKVRCLNSILRRCLMVPFIVSE